MKRKSMNQTQCPIARSLDRVGDWWSILILRDALHGFTRFDQFQKSLDIAPNILTTRLTKLVEDGLMVRQRYSEKPPRDEYLLTECGRDFRPIVLSLLSWGNRYFAPEGESVQLVDTTTGLTADPILVDRISGRNVTDPVFQIVAGPVANERVQQRYPKRMPPSESIRL
jgi:DNA-binding HxlR family transcriptional regulator